VNSRDIINTYDNELKFAGGKDEVFILFHKYGSFSELNIEECNHFAALKLVSKMDAGSKIILQLPGPQAGDCIVIDEDIECDTRAVCRGSGGRFIASVPKSKWPDTYEHEGKVFELLHQAESMNEGDHRSNFVSFHGDGSRIVCHLCNQALMCGRKPFNPRPYITHFLGSRHQSKLVKATACRDHLFKQNKMTTFFKFSKRAVVEDESSHASVNAVSLDSSCWVCPGIPLRDNDLAYIDLFEQYGDMTDVKRVHFQRKKHASLHFDDCPLQTAERDGISKFCKTRLRNEAPTKGQHKVIKRLRRMSQVQKMIDHMDDPELLPERVIELTNFTRIKSGENPGLQQLKSRIRERLAFHKNIASIQEQLQSIGLLQSRRSGAIISDEQYIVRFLKFWKESGSEFQKSLLGGLVDALISKASGRLNAPHAFILSHLNTANM
jgi:hypothetical protein